MLLMGFVRRVFDASSELIFFVLETLLFLKNVI